jgi:hypothetical protein
VPPRLAQDILGAVSLVQWTVGGASTRKPLGWHQLPLQTSAQVACSFKATKQWTRGPCILLDTKIHWVI